MRRVASGLCAVALLLSPVVAFAASDASGTPAPVIDATSARRGVAVVAIGGADAADAAWPVALAVYGDEALRPRLEDRDARALAGAAPAKDAPKSTRELAELRAQVHGDDTASRLLLKEIARRVGALGLVLVFPKTDTSPAEARLYDAADDVVEPTLHREAPTGGWSGLVATLRGRYAKEAPNPVTAAPGAPAGDAKSSAPAKASKSSGSVLGSPWLWGAIGVAVLGAVIVGVASKGSDSTGSSPVRVEWGK